MLVNDQFQLVATASVATTMIARIVVQFDSGRIRQFNHTLVSASDRTVTSENFGHVEENGYVVRATVAAITAVKRGQTFVELATIDTNERTQDILSRDYLHSNNQLTLDVLRNSLEGRGFIRTVTGANPDAGNDPIDAVPANARWRLLTYSCVLVADATSTNRTPNLVVDDGASANRRFVLEAGVVITASQTRTIMHQIGSNDVNGTGVNFADQDNAENVVVTDMMPPQSDLVEEDRVRLSTTNLQAGDDYAAPIFQVEEWIQI